MTNSGTTAPKQPSPTCVYTTQDSGVDAYKAPPGLSQGFRDAERIKDEPIPVMDMPDLRDAQPSRTARVHSMPKPKRRFRAGVCLAGAIAAVVLVATQIPRPVAAHASMAVRAPVTAWTPFLAACQSGPSPGQGNSLEGCTCWKQNLQAVAIGADDALDIINAATSYTSEAAAYTVPENIGNLSARDAMNGCDLYQESP